MKTLFLVCAVLLLAGCTQTKTLALRETALQTPDSSTESLQRGKVLFRNKGCVTCHVHDGVEGESGVLDYIDAPDLSNYANDPAFLRRWLADPAEARPDAEMPNLQLSSEEIEDLIAFLNATQ